MVEKISYGILAFLIVFLSMQDLLLAAIYDKTANVGLVKVFLVGKEVMILFGLIAMIELFRKGKCIYADLLIAVFFLIIFIYSIIGFFFYDFKSVVSEARSFISVFLVYFMMRSVSDIYKIKRLMQILIITGTWVIFFAYIELGVLSFWSDIVPIGKYMVDVKGLENLYYSASGVPDNYYRNGNRRMVSVFGDPLFFGYFLFIYILFLSLYYQIFLQGRLRFLLVFSVFTLFLSYVRGPIVAYIAMMMFQFFRRNVYVRIFSVVLVVAITPYVVYSSGDLYNSFMNNVAGSNLGHIEAFINGMLGIVESPLGVGVGGAGTLAGAYGGSVYGNTENTLLNLWLQGGFVSVLAFVSILISWLVYLYKDSSDYVGNVLKNTYIGFLFALAILMFISPQLWALRTGYYFFLFVGVIVSLKGYKRVGYSR